MTPTIAIALNQITTDSVAIPSLSTSLGTTLKTISDALDNGIRDDMQATANIFLGWVVASAFVVFVGCLLEGPELLHEWKPIWFSCFTWNSAERLHKFERKLKTAALIGWFLIGLGVMGEGMFEVFQSRAEGQLQTLNDTLLQDARLTAAQAQLLAAQTGNATQQLKTEAESARRDEERERFERIKLEEDISPRRLSSMERRTIASNVANKGYPPTAVIEYESNDSEAYAFGVDIGQALADAKWKPSDPHGMTTMLPGPFPFGSGPKPLFGVDVQTCPNNVSKRAGKDFADALSALGFDATLTSLCDWPSRVNPGLSKTDKTDINGILIYIHARPEGPQGEARLRKQKKK